MKTIKGKGAWMAKVGEKGQIVIPKEARDMFEISPGDTLLLLGDISQGLAIVSGDKVAAIAQQIFGTGPFLAEDAPSQESGERANEGASSISGDHP